MYMHDGFREIVVFNSWRTETALGLLVTCFVLALVAILFEGLRTWRDHLALVANEKRKYEYLY